MQIKRRKESKNIPDGQNTFTKRHRNVQGKILTHNLLARKLFHYGSTTQKCEANKPLRDVTTGPIF